LRIITVNLAEKGDFVFEPYSFGIVTGASIAVTGTIPGVKRSLSSRSNSVALL